MSTNKLKLKLTPEEEAQRRLRKERKKERKRKHDDQESRAGASSKRAREHESSSSHLKWASSDEDEIEIGPQSARASGSTSNIPPPQSYAHKPDYDAMKAEIEQQRFREKMFDAMGEDERLDSVEARFNDYGEVPDRWRTDGGKSRQNVFEDDFVKQDPAMMDDEEYAEWIRVGMYRKTHAEEYAEQQRRKAAKAARRAEEKARKAETARLEKAAEEERKRRKLESASRRLDWAREDYNARWEILLASAATIDNAQSTGDIALLSFEDIPWPIATAHHRDKPEHRYHSKSRPPESLVVRKSINVEELTADAIASFLLPVAAAISDAERASKKKERKDKLRETFLRFHPDKFEGRFMKRIKEGEREKVRKAIGQVSRALNTLMGDGD